MGRLVCKLFSEQSPLAAANFIGLAEGTKPWVDPVTKEKMTGKPFYDGTTFHRVIPGFMIQGGDRVGDGSGDAGYFFDNESTPGLSFDVPGRLAMANAGPNTNGTQFFITEQAYPDLNGGYTIFGQCDEPSTVLVASITHVARNSSDKPADAGGPEQGDDRARRQADASASAGCSQYRAGWAAPDQRPERASAAAIDFHLFCSTETELPYRCRAAKTRKESTCRKQHSRLLKARSFASCLTPKHRRQ